MARPEKLPSRQQVSEVRSTERACPVPGAEARPARARNGRGREGAPENGASPAGAETGKLRRWRPASGEIPAPRRRDKPGPTGSDPRGHGSEPAGRMRRLGLKAQPEKTRIVHLRAKGIDFLGCPLRMAVSRRYKGRWYLYRWPNGKAMAKLVERIRGITNCRHSGMKLADVIEALNPVLRGWGQYFANGNAARKFNVIDRYVWKRLTLFANRVRGRNDPTCTKRFDYAWYRDLGVYRLMGLIRYPTADARAAG